MISIDVAALMEVVGSISVDDATLVKNTSQFVG
jgi:energy-converting hydrogenase A subunit M